ncbi:TRAP transporter small permease [Rhodophyticola porphyridii]|uniref:TRAP transporter small permease n=1 Tax=Rhodophyticola porphyridii TaxID=1852017 RepID=UPI0035CFF9A0
MPRQTPSTLLWVDRQLGRLSGLVAILGALAVLGLMFVTLTAVLWRYALNDPIFGISDISTMTLIIVAGASVCYGARHGAHVSVNVIGMVAGRRLTRFTDALMRLMAFGILALASYALADKACGAERACLTNNMSIVHRPFYYFLSATMGLFALNVLLQLIVGLYHLNGDDPNEIAD